jgi:hypothetical protein
MRALGLPAVPASAADAIWSTLEARLPNRGRRGESEDRFHRRSIYVAQGLDNGVDLWTESEAHGAMLQRGAPEVESGGDRVVIARTVDWHGPEGQRLIEEERRVAIVVDGALRVIDHSSVYRANHGDVTFGDTKEGGLLAIRVASSMDATGQGRMENSSGDVFAADAGPSPPGAFVPQGWTTAGPWPTTR